MLLCIASVASQNEINAELPQITPQSPEAGSLGRFGNVPINPSTGQMSFTVPIHTIGVDENQWPIALQYNYGGFILEAKPSMAGWGWNLNAYGSITKQVRGLPDGHPKGYYGSENVKYKIDDHLANPMLTSVGDFEKFTSGEYDSQVDKYTVNIGGTGFSFKLRKDSNNNDAVVPYYLSKHNYKVIVNMSTSSYFEVDSFVVTDDRGIKYHFDNVDSEGPINVMPEDPYNVDKTTAWMLSSIEYLNGQNIVFDYQPETFSTWDFSATGVSLEGNIPNGNTGDAATVYIGGYQDQMRSTEVNRQILQSITFPKGSLEFSTIIKGQGNTTWKVFDQILLKDHNGSVVNTFDISHHGNRDALVQIDKNGELYYGFEYFGIHTQGVIPPFPITNADKPYDQDFYRFYNQANNNQAISVGSSGGTANKESIFNAMQMGAMKRINYPTGGFSEVTYEQNQVKKLYTQSNGFPGFNKEVYLDLDPILGDATQERYAETTLTLDYPVRAQLSHFVHGSVGFGNAIALQIEGGDPITPGCYNSEVLFSLYYPDVIADARAKMRIPNPGSPGPCDHLYPYPMVPPLLDLRFEPEPGCFQTFPHTSDIDCDGDDKATHAGSSGGHFYMPAGTYTFRISTHAIPENTNSYSYYTDDDPSLHAGIRLDYYDPDPNGDGNLGDIYVNEDTGGIRVAKITNYPNQGDRVTTYYDYNDDDGFSTAFENQRPYTYDALDLVIIDYDINNNIAIYERTENHHKLNSFGYLEASNGVPVYYRRIKKYNKVDYQFVPLPPGRSYTVTPIPGDTNGDGTLIHSNRTPMGEWPPIVIIDGDPGTLETVYPEGYTILEYWEPSQDVDYAFPLVPRHLDKSGARMRKEEQFTIDDISVSSIENDYLELRHDLDVPSEGEYDQSDDHPWSFIMTVKQLRTIDFVNKCYFYNSLCAPHIKDLHTTKKYKEVEKNQLIRQTIQTSEEISTTTTTIRDTYNYYYPIEQISTTSNGDELKTTFEYAFDLPTEGVHQSMIGINQINTPIGTKTYRAGTLMGQQKSVYVGGVGGGYKPGSIEVAKGSNALETRMIIDSYDGVGNVTQVHKSNDVVISYLYGYGYNYPVAEIVGATFSEALAALPNNPNAIYHLGFQDQDGTSLISILEQMRDTLNQTTNAQVTIYTYKSLVGVSTVTDPRGYRMEYFYDSQNRLETIKDGDGNVVQKSEYNYQSN